MAVEPKYEVWGQSIMSDGEPPKFLEDCYYLGEAHEAATQWQEGDPDLAIFIKDKETGKIIA